MRRSVCFIQIERSLKKRRLRIVCARQRSFAQNLNGGFECDCFFSFCTDGLSLFKSGVLFFNLIAVAASRRHFHPSTSIAEYLDRTAARSRAHCSNAKGDSRRRGTRRLAKLRRRRAARAMRPLNARKRERVRQHCARFLSALKSAVRQQFIFVCLHRTVQIMSLVHISTRPKNHFVARRV